MARASAHLVTRRFAPAEASLRRALELAPWDREASRTLGSLLILMERSEESIEFTEQYLERHPNDSGAWFNLAMAFYGQDQIDAARRAGERARTLDPNHEKVQRLLAILAK